MALTRPPLLVTPSRLELRPCRRSPARPDTITFRPYMPVTLASGPVTAPDTPFVLVLLDRTPFARPLLSLKPPFSSGVMPTFGLYKKFRRRSLVEFTFTALAVPVESSRRTKLRPFCQPLACLVTALEFLRPKQLRLHMARPYQTQSLS